MATRFKCTQIGTAGGDTFSLYIDDANFSGTATDICLQRDSLKIAYEGSTSTRYTPVIPSSCEFSMIIENATHEALITDLAAAAEGRFTVKITRGITGAEELYWPGYILADIARLEDLRYPFRLQVRATDGLGRLKGIDYRNGSVPYHFDTFITHLTRCLSEGELPSLYFSTSDVFLRTSIEWIENGHGTLATSKCPLAFSRVDGDIWAEENPGQLFEFKSCYEVIESICAGWKAQILFSDGCYRIRQVNGMRNATFTERRFSRTGTLISSNASISYPKTINHTPDGTKISYPTVGFFPALKSVTVKYDHDTYKNYLDNAGARWSNTGVNLPLTFNDVKFDSDSRIRLSGTLYLKLSSPANTPYRMVFFLDLLAGSNRWKSLTSVPVPTINNIIRDTPVWDPSIDKYHITTEFIYTEEWEGEVNFDIITDPVPSGTSSFSVNFQENTSYTPDGLTSLIIVESFEVKGLALTIQGIDSQENYYVERKYKASNTVAGNSKTEDIETIFGHAVKPWTPRRIQVSSDGSTWVDSTATWKTYGSSGTGYEFGELLARYMLAGQKKPTRIMEATFRGSVLDAHRRYGTLDGFFWAFVNGSINVVSGQINGEFIEVAYDDAADGETTDVPGPPTSIIKVPSVVPTRANVASNFEISSVVALATQATNFTPSAVTAGVKTSLALSLPAKEGSYRDGDEIFLLDPEKGKIESLTVTATNAAGATSLAVSGTLQNAYPKGAYVLYNILNKYTTSGSATSDLAGNISAGQIAFGSGTNIISGENNLWWDAANDRLGVRTNSPISTFQIIQPSTGNQFSKGITLSDPTATGTPLFRMVAGYPGNYDGYLLYYRNSLLCQMIEDNGAVSYFNNLKLNENSLLTAIQHSNSWLKFVNSSGTRYAELVGWTDLRLATNGYGADIWLIASTGNTGIGTNAPARKLHVAGTARITGSAGTPTALMGRDANGDIANLTLGSGLSITSGTLSATASGTIGGTIAAAQVAYGSGSNTITGEAEFLYTAATNRLQVGAGTPQAAFNAFFGAVTTVEAFRGSANASGSLIMLLQNAWGSGGTGNSIFQILTAAGGGDPVIQFGVTGGSPGFAVGIDNSDADKFKITRDAALPGETGNSSFVITNEATPKFGFNVDAPAYVIDMAERARFGQVMSRPATYVTPTVGTGAGTGAAVAVSDGSGNGFTLTIDTGTTPTLNGNIALITIPWFSGKAVKATFSAGNPLAANHCQRFYILSTSNNNIQLTNANTALQASSSYVLHFTFFG